MTRSSSARSRSFRLLKGSLLAFAIGATTLLSSSEGFAQATEDRVDSTGKGIAGGALLGGEAVMMIEAAFGVEPWWAYLIGGVAGAGAGGAAGYLTETIDEPKVPMLMLVGGLALVIPTAILVITATSYRPPDSFTEDKGAQAKSKLPGRFGPTRRRVALQRQAERRQARAASRRRLKLSRPVPTGSLLQVAVGESWSENNTRLSLGVPNISVSSAVSNLERSQLPVEQGALADQGARTVLQNAGTQVRLPLLAGTF